MSAKLQNRNVVTPCYQCAGAITTYERKLNGAALGSFSKMFRTPTPSRPGEALEFVLMRCAGCGHGGLALILKHVNWRPDQGATQEKLIAFYPAWVEEARVPELVPVDIVAEVREAELCAANRAYRAACAMLRSALEKALSVNGYDNRTGSLMQRIDAAAADGVITEMRARRAHDEIRVLGNDILHDPWRKVNDEEFRLSHHYTQRILEDFYDDRPMIEGILQKKGRLQSKA